MAKENDTKLNILTPEVRQKLEKLGKRIDESQKVLELFKEMGIGVGDLESKLQWAKKRKDILLDKG